jgi:hypothetical protein
MSSGTGINGPDSSVGLLARQSVLDGTKRRGTSGPIHREPFFIARVQCVQTRQRTSAPSLSVRSVAGDQEPLDAVNRVTRLSGYGHDK